MLRDNNKTAVGILIAAVFTLTLLVVAASSTQAATEGLAGLAVSDCVKCHQKEPATIADKGGLHQTAVTCLDCHLEHGPWGTKTIPECSMCHEGKSHFELPNCLSCHSDPHNPLGLQLAGDLVAPCLTCHEEQGKEFKDYASKHALQSCTFCHDVHGRIPDCSECHQPHAPGQVMADCLSCHPVHHPRQIEPAITTQRSFCVACHEEIGALMEKTTTRHQSFTCAYCHRGQHPSVPQCQGCHGEPHAAAMHQKMPNCLDCHIDAHNLQK